MKLKIAAVAAVDDDEILKTNLLQSSLLQPHDIDFFKIENAQSAGQADNRGIELTGNANLIIFTHQGVCLTTNGYEKPVQACDSLNNNGNVGQYLLGLLPNVQATSKTPKAIAADFGYE